MREQLKPCPFCKGVADIKGDNGKYYVQCRRCGVSVDDERLSDATGSFEPFATKGEAVNAWNNFAEQEVADAIAAWNRRVNND